MRNKVVVKWLLEHLIGLSLTADGKISDQRLEIFGKGICSAVGLMGK